MNFLQRLFGGGKSPQDGGIYIYARCDHCGRVLHTRLDPQHDLAPEDDGSFVSRKTLMDDRCFRRIPMRASFDNARHLVSLSLEGATSITREQWADEKELPRRPSTAPTPPDDL